MWVVLQAQSSHRVSSDAEALRKKIVAAEERARAQQEQVLECQHKVGREGGGPRQAARSAADGCGGGRWGGLLQIERLMDVLKEKEAQVQAAKQEAARAWQQVDSKVGQ